MDKFDRIFKLHTIFTNQRTPISLVQLQEKMACSESTTRRAIETLRDTLGAPVEYDRQRNGHYYDQTQVALYELPGLWLNQQELYALLVSYDLLANLQPNILSSHIEPLKNRIECILQHQHAGSPDIGNRIRILQQAARVTNIEHFQCLASAVLKRQQVRVLYHGRERDVTTERIISPQRLIYYRSNWYLDAWCHLRESLRTFSLDRLQPIVVLESKAEDIREDELEKHYVDAYGIFAGVAENLAILLFSAEAARWVADEQWHPKQVGKILKNGSYELEIPYGDARELVMEILKYGDEVEVIDPPELRSLLIDKLQRTLSQYKEK